ncbi:acyl-CoA dehydrogenase family protein [Rhodococcus jostii]|uniref:Acyl-CoA dehydrogenase n=1 Tax=Rhodococcus jostii TaxID=132919 RepID=A0A1H5M092_RHOJO|nr:acyl-CoA dehydrogenase family protein [Rhodococcus jostii]SEE82733.1 acyl-CoA dehydrogenase [Rhodococcus jostii]
MSIDDHFPHLTRDADLRRAVRGLCSRFDVAYWDQKDADQEFPEEFFRAFADSGFLGTFIPEEYGGGGGSTANMVAILEEVGASGGGLNACSTVHTPLLCAPTILAFGTEKQRTELLPQIAAGKLYTTFGVTEPDAGTDTTRIAMKAVDDGTSWRISGTKVWNTGAMRGDKVLLLARTSEPAEGERRGLGITLFLADLNSETVEIRPIPKIGRNAVASCEVFFEGTKVPYEDVIGEVGQGFYHLLHSLNSERLFVAAETVGLGRWALAAATQYSLDRVVFGRQIGKNQGVQHPLAKSYLDLLAAAEVLYRAVDEYEVRGGAAIGSLANAAKYLCSEAAVSSTDAAMQVFGGYSFSREYHIGRQWIESRLPRVAPVNNQMILNFIAERTLGLPKSY